MESQGWKENSVDDLVMLLSTDWFDSLWPTLGIQVHETKKLEVRNHCRNLVKKFAVVSGDFYDYFQCDLSNARQVITRNQFIKCLDSSLLNHYAIASVLQGLERKSYTSERLKLVEDLTALLAEDYFDDSDLRLENVLKWKLLSYWNIRKDLYDEWGNLDVDFTYCNLSSDSSWDQFVRSLTPKIPTALSDILSNSRIIVPEIEYVWCAAAEQLCEKELSTLLDWYRKCISKLSNQRLKLKTFSLSNNMNSIQNFQLDFAPKSEDSNLD